MRYALPEADPKPSTELGQRMPPQAELDTEIEADDEDDKPRPAQPTSSGREDGTHRNLEDRRKSPTRP